MRLAYASLAVALTLLFAPPASAQWTPQSPVPTYLDVRGIGAPAADRVFVATDDDSFDDGGALWESQDGGDTWTQRDVPFNLNDPLNGLFFLDGQRGWAYGNDNYRTLDGGTTWEELPFLGSTYRMEFWTPSFGYATTNGDNWISRDGGLNWELAPNELFDFDFADDGLGLLGLGVSASGIYRTLDGGLTFTLAQAGDADDIVFLTPTVAVGIVDGAFVRSTDAGLTWTAGVPADGRSQLQRVSDAAVLAWGRSGFFPNTDGQLYRSADGGQTWTDLGTVFADGTLAFAVLSDQTVVAADAMGGMHRSADAGATWAQTFTSPGPRPGAFSSARPHFADAQTGYYGYAAGFVIKTSDGGQTWQQVSSGYGESLSGIDRFDDGRMIAVGERGTLLTNDGTPGARWILNQALTNVELVAVDVVAGTSVVAADADGRVYRSADGGATWTAGATAPQLNDAYDLHFDTLLDGWVVGQGFSAGSLFHTTDGGDTWTAGVKTDGNPVIGTHRGVDFVGDSGWAAGSSDRYYRTVDDGATWIEEYLPDPQGFLSVGDMDFFDASVGYAIGLRGYAARSDDGGVTWTILPTPNNTDDFTDIYLISQNELWVSTRGDEAYYTATGGQNWAILDSETGGFGGFTGIAASPEGDAWMVGFLGALEHFVGPPPPPLNRPPEASFTFQTTRLTVNFTDTSFDPDGTIVSYFWDFGDSRPDSTSTEQHPSHTYDDAGTYLVRLTVTDDDGDTGSALRAIAVQPGPGGTFGDFTEVTPFESPFVTPQDEDFIVATTAPADFDGDGDLDIAVLGYYVVYNQSVDYQLLLLQNDGEAAPDEWDFTYVDVPIGTLTSGSSDMAWGDVDGDGDEDLVVGSDGATVIYRNDAGTLVLTDTELPGYYEDNDQADFDLQSISWADYDNDSDLDLLLPSVFDFDSTFTYRTALMRNDGPDGTGGFVFTETDSTFAPTGHAQSSWADYDGDGDLDLLLNHLAPLTPNGFIRRYRNDGGGTFVGEDVLGTLTVEHGEIQWADYDADGDYDILVVGNLGEVDGTFTRAAIRVYENDADTFTPFDVIACIPCEGWFDLNAATWADYDSDGDVDILLAGTYNPGGQIDGRAKIYANDGAAFSDTGNDLPAPRSSGSRGGSFTWLDIDGEGDLDYFIAGEYFVPGGNGLVEMQMHLYRNDATARNGAPSAPTGLTANTESGGGTVALSWNPATDDSTPSAALTYDLALYRDGVPLVSPRRLPEPGTVSAVTDWTLTGLAGGTYTWTVRAVDSAYNGGPTAQGTFTVGAPPAFALLASNTSPLTVAPGGRVAFQYAVTNNTTAPAAGDLYFVARRPNGMPVARGIIRSGTIPAGATATGRFTQRVPGTVPHGRYTYHVVAGQFPGLAVAAQSFEIVVASADVAAADVAGADATRRARTSRAGEGAAEAWAIEDAAPWTIAAAQQAAGEAAMGPEQASSTSLPEVAELSAVYPNPMRRAATVRFALPETAVVDLAVYDLLGRLVTRLAEDELPAGYHDVRWDADRLAAGTYLIRFATGSHVETRRVVLVR